MTPRSFRFNPSRNSAFFVILVLLTKVDNNDNLSLLKSIPSSDDKHLRDNDHILLFYRVNLSQPLAPQDLIRLPKLSWWMWIKKRQYTLGRQDIYSRSSNFLFDLLRQSIPNVVILQTQLQIFPIYSEQAINLKVLPTRLSWSQLLSRGVNEWPSKCWFQGSVPFHLPPPNCFCNYLKWEHHLIPMGTW